MADLPQASSDEVPAPELLVPDGKLDEQPQEQLRPSTIEYKCQYNKDDVSNKLCSYYKFTSKQREALN